MNDWAIHSAKPVVRYKLVLKPGTDGLVQAKIGTKYILRNRHIAPSDNSQEAAAATGMKLWVGLIFNPVVHYACLPVLVDCRGSRVGSSRIEAMCTSYE